MLFIDFVKMLEYLIFRFVLLFVFLMLFIVNFRLLNVYLIMKEVFFYEYFGNFCLKFESINLLNWYLVWLSLI